MGNKQSTSKESKSGEISNPSNITKKKPTNKVGFFICVNSLKFNDINMMRICLLYIKINLGIYLGIQVVVCNDFLRFRINHLFSNIDRIHLINSWNDPVKAISGKTMVFTKTFYKCPACWSDNANSCKEKKD